MRSVVPWLVGVLMSATLITAGALPLLSEAQAGSVTEPTATPHISTPTPRPVPATQTQESRRAPRISDAEKRASSTAHKKPLRALDTCEMRFSAVGASFTQANTKGQPDADGGAWMASGEVGDRSWAYWTDADPQLLLDGGWALGGQKTSDLAERAQRSWFPVDTNLVILAGTNNLLQGTPIEDARGDIEKIVRISGISPERVYLVQLPPSNITPDRIEPYNAMLAKTARDNGFHLVDVSTFLDNGSGGYIDGATEDGIHLTKDNAVLVGRSIAAAINANSGCQNLPEFTDAAEENDLGNPVDVPHCDLPDGACVQLFEHGALRRSNAGEATLLPARLTEKWREFGIGALGYPVKAPECTSEGCVTRFALGTVYSTKDEAFAVRGAILAEYRKQGGHAGRLGRPTSDETCDDEGCEQTFTGGTIAWTPATGARVS